MTKEEVFEKLEKLKISKVYISFFYEKNEVNIISNIVIMNDEKYYVDWNNEVYSDKSYITKPIFDFDKKDCDLIDGLLTWDVNFKKLTISGKKQKNNIFNFNVEI